MTIPLIVVVGRYTVRSGGHQGPADQLRRLSRCELNHHSSDADLHLRSAGDRRRALLRYSLSVRLLPQLHAAPRRRRHRHLLARRNWRRTHSDVRMESRCVSVRA